MEKMLQWDWQAQGTAKYNENSLVRGQQLKSSLIVNHTSVIKGDIFFNWGAGKREKDRGEKGIEVLLEEYPIMDDLAASDS